MASLLSFEVPLKSSDPFLLDFHSPSLLPLYSHFQSLTVSRLASHWYKEIEYSITSVVVLPVLSATSHALPTLKCLSHKRFINNVWDFDMVYVVPGYRSWGPGSDSRRYQIFWEVVGLKRGSLSLVSTTEELLKRKNSGTGLAKPRLRP
jgi:hypothetical protein